MQPFTAARLACDPLSALVGGAPVNEQFAESIGADAYCRDAAVAVETAKRLLTQAQPPPGGPRRVA